MQQRPRNPSGFRGLSFCSTNRFPPKSTAVVEALVETTFCNRAIMIVFTSAEETERYRRLKREGEAELQANM
jgi:hypothetical protein